MPHIHSSLRDLGVIFDKSILFRSPILVVLYHAGTADSCYGTNNEQENIQNSLIEGYIRREMNVDIDQKYQ